MTLNEELKLRFANYNTISFIILKIYNNIQYTDIFTIITIMKI